MNYAVEQRLRLIDFLLLHFSSVSRAELMDYFGTSEVTATRDLTLYRQQNPGNAILDQSSKRYVRAPNFKRAYP
jgi:predicted DNA-binding transcriptional regulator YafY